MERIARTLSRTILIGLVSLVLMGVQPVIAHAQALTSACSGNTLCYRGGAVEVQGQVYLDFWGSQWSTGFITGGYSSQQAQTYITDFFTSVAGSAWANITTQYCMGVPIAATACGSAGIHITNYPGQLAGVKVHNTALPHHLRASDVGREAIWAMNYFGGYNPNATYFVFTPDGYYVSNTPSSRPCAWHAAVHAGEKHLVNYAYIPYEPTDQDCSQVKVNKTSNSYGNGYFDGFSLFAGHEYAEALTDPHGNAAGSQSIGWATNQDPAQEIADICENMKQNEDGDIRLGPHLFAVEALWSNADNRCELSYGASSTPGTIVEYPVPTTNSYVQDITSGPDGALWFTEPESNQIGRITTAGIITEYPVPTLHGFPLFITWGPDRALWFTEPGGNQIGRITTAGIITEYPVPTIASYPFGITSGPDGAVWFTEQYGNQIGRVATTGCSGSSCITEYPLPTSGHYLTGITTGPDGALWFGEENSSTYTFEIGRIAVIGCSGSSCITGYPVPTAGSNPFSITTGPDGNLWFTEASSGVIGRITTLGSIAEQPLPSGRFPPVGITSGPVGDGALWFTEPGSNQIGRITTDINVPNNLSEYPIPTAGSYPFSITSGPDGALWFTEPGSNQIGRITP